MFAFLFYASIRFLVEKGRTATTYNCISICGRNRNCSCFSYFFSVRFTKFRRPSRAPDFTTLTVRARLRMSYSYLLSIARHCHQFERGFCFGCLTVAAGSKPLARKMLRLSARPPIGRSVSAIEVGDQPYQRHRCPWRAKDPTKTAASAAFSPSVH